MKCPFCGTELEELREWGTLVGLVCPKFCKTRVGMDVEIWQALIANWCGWKVAFLILGIDILMPFEVLQRGRENGNK